MPPARPAINAGLAAKGKAANTSQRKNSASPKATPKSTPRAASPGKISKGGSTSGNGKVSKKDKGGKEEAALKGNKAREKAAQELTADIILERAASQLRMAEELEQQKGTFGSLHSALGEKMGAMLEVDGKKLKDVFQVMDKNGDVSR